MPKFCEPQELLLKPEMGSTLARHFEKNFIQIVYMKYYLKKKKDTAKNSNRQSFHGSCNSVYHRNGALGD